MQNVEYTNEAAATVLCKSCGLCCTGHLFAWAKLRPSELDPAEALGMTVYRSDPTQRGFSQPCPLWQGQCTIYASDKYPHVCRSYKCKLLKQMQAGHDTLPHALQVIQQTKEMIRSVEEFLPATQLVNFRERLVAYLESPNRPVQSGTVNRELEARASALLHCYEDIFGVDDLIEKPDESQA